MIIAQLTPEMLKGVAPVLISIGALLWITNEVFKFAKNVKGKEALPPNEHLEMAHNTLSGRVDRVEGEVSGIRSDMKADRAASVLDGSARSKTIFQHIEKLREEMKADLEKQTDRLEARSDKQAESLAERIEGMPAQVIALLKNTGAI